ncbi:MAG: haloacid dehalogenase-like hydrolase [Treponema sp.]|nr:haloacid dehalogenase-like hydrolase [Treponema sp.]
MKFSSKKSVLFFSCIVLAIFFSSCKKDDSLSYWNDNAPAKKALTEYVESVTKKGSADFIPVKDRIAVFDLDGTLFCETDPIYFDWILYTQRVLDDENYKNQATEEQIALANDLREAMKTRNLSEDLEGRHAALMPQLFKGLTVEEFKDYIRAYKKQDTPGFKNMKRGEAFYVPMVQVVNYLVENDFTVYICSGTDRITVRTQIEDVLPVDESHVIGTDNTLVATAQGETSGLEYVFTNDDDVVLGGKQISKNIKMNKVSVLAQEIGRKPVLSFGNSSGDASMANYVINKNPHKSLAFMLLCDDTEREYGNIPKAEKMKSACEKNGWIPISMHDDWKTIYGDGIEKK